ncbi:hypothetical protein ER308_08110 [Egibacter rhizosphaerae]|uniref:Signal peptidase I n=1 Tax=Egibacter rhizosphaerae TaxID=1670831 RepID=A0A411YEJ5_9ACTN|nr:S24/S26 family peptidase [Egibacter rhizosphaerae]QBI19517.1 hypothetical protein ER308_08110 [Egibacter rhizosphaerae]
MTDPPPSDGPEELDPPDRPARPGGNGRRGEQNAHNGQAAPATPRRRPWPRRREDGPPVPALLLRGLAAMFLVSLAVAALTVGAFTWLDGAEAHVVTDDAMTGALERGDVALVQPAGAISEGIVVRWVDDRGAAHVHRVVREGEALRMIADRHRSPVAEINADRVTGVVDRRVPWAGAPLVWLAEGSVGRLGAFLLLCAAAIGTIAAVPLRPGVIGERDLPPGDGSENANAPGDARRGPRVPA